MNDRYTDSAQRRRLPRWLRLLWVLLLFAGLMGALICITAMLMHHPSRLRYRLLALAWMLGSGGLVLIAFNAWLIHRETDVPSDW